MKITHPLLFTEKKEINRERERETDSQSDRETERERQRDKETERDRKRDKERDRQTDRLTEIERHNIRVRFSKDAKQFRPIPQKFIKKYFSLKLMKITHPLLFTEKKEIKRERETERQRQRDRETERQRDRETERQRDRETKRQRETERETKRETDRLTEIERHNIRVRFSNDAKQLRPIPQNFIKKYFSFKLMKIILPLLYTEKKR
jgi:hypothetical protein